MMKSLLSVLCFLLVGALFMVNFPQLPTNHQSVFLNPVKNEESTKVFDQKELISDFKEEMKNALKEHDENLNDSPKPMAIVANPAIAEEEKISNGSTNSLALPLIDFTAVAELTTPAVVHIKTRSYGKSNESYYNPFKELFGEEEETTEEEQNRYSMGSGSGVIINSSGYIVTNYHVIDEATSMEVILNDKRSYAAEIVGIDTDTDLAVLKVEANNLPYMGYANSDLVKVGSWVMAVGNPFNLSSTVTTGIVSAKARNIGISNDNLAIESFIQTDAAVNPGNSGGALVNLSGELIGINTAIATPTGYYAGYSFALPANIVKKVVTDIMEFGEVKRGFLGVSIRDVDARVAETLDLDAIEGVYVAAVALSGAAYHAGIEEGDVITTVGNRPVNSAAELQEMVSRYRPGDEVAVTIKRNNQKQALSVKLKNTY